MPQDITSFAYLDGTVDRVLALVFVSTGSFLTEIGGYFRAREKSPVILFLRMRNKAVALCGVHTILPAPKRILSIRIKR